MPWTPEEFKRRHNKGLTGAQAKKAASMANAMLREGVDEGVAIATANKHAKERKHMMNKIVRRRGRQLERSSG